VTVDQKTYALAEAFLADTPAHGSKKITQKLAEFLQRNAEDFVADVYDSDLRRMMEAEPVLCETCKKPIGELGHLHLSYPAGS
jgi:hypothetical protein